MRKASHPGKWAAAQAKAPYGAEVSAPLTALVLVLGVSSMALCCTRQWRPGLGHHAYETGQGFGLLPK